MADLPAFLHRSRRHLLLAFWVLMGLTACSEEGSPPTEPVAADADVLTLEWSDLMPAGETERLEDLYGEFYDDLDRRMATAEQKSLADAAKAGSLGMIEEGSALDQMPQLGTFNVVEELDGKHIRLPGFIVPLDYDTPEELRGFLFVPYYGACIHTPPPPPNQLVYVDAGVGTRVEDIWSPYWATGILRTERVDNELGNAAYTLELISLTLMQ